MDMNMYGLPYDVSSDDLAYVLCRRFPDAVHGKDFLCAHRVKENSSERTSPAIIVRWSREEPQPTPTMIAEYIRTYSDGLEQDRSRRERLVMFKPISARQLWLMARQVGITKAQVLATLEPAEGDTDEVLGPKEVLHIELTEPPLAGFLRDSPAAEDFRQYMGLPPEQFDDMWRMAQEI